ncbi:MAG: hypothetical protein AAB403_03960 [Planctomycetota bacterium]
MTFDERVEAIVAIGYTHRQAQFLVTVMLHSGVCIIRQYCDFSGITRGRKTQDFFNLLIERQHASATTDAHSKTRVFHVYSRSLYEAIGEPDNRNRKPAAMGAAVERLMLLDTVIASRDIEWLATERDKVAHFARLFGTSVRPNELPHFTFGTPPNTTTRYFPDKLPIGILPDQSRLFTYLVCRSSPVDFRAFLNRHAHLFRALRKWRLRLLIPVHLKSARTAYEAAVRQELLTPLRLSMADELRWFLEAKRAHACGGQVDQERLARANRAFDSPRYRALYRRWLELGPRALDGVTSSSLVDAMDRGIGEVESYVLQHPYHHLRSFVGTA